MSASYATARALLAGLEVNGEELTNDEELVVVSNARTFAVLALAEELEALVELLRERLPEQREVRVEYGNPRVDLVAAYRKGRDDERAGIYRPAGCTCVVTEPGARPYPLPSEWREGCPAHPIAPTRTFDVEPCEHCGGDRLRADFTGSDYCHAPGPHTSCGTCGVPLAEHGVDGPTDHEWIRP